ncbi:hypothetical protein B7463_g8706, partial [Scytalidium lignicola]
MDEPQHNESTPENSPQFHISNDDAENPPELIENVALSGNVESTELRPGADSPVLKTAAGHSLVLEETVQVDALTKPGGDEEGVKVTDDGKESFGWDAEFGPEDPKWKNTRARFVQLLRTQNITVQHILEREFKEFQRFLLIYEGDHSRLRYRVQRQNAQKYKNLLKDGGKFAGCKDNLATKLSMIHFGFPVQPITINNIANRKADPEEHDPEDEVGLWDQADLEAMGVAGNPLEFLDAYSERRYGQTLHKPPYIQHSIPRSSTVSGPGIPNQSTTKNENQATSSQDSSAGPSYPRPEHTMSQAIPSVSMRGGAGKITLYGYTGKLQISGTKQSFRDASLRLSYCDCEENIPSDWEFAVDIGMLDADSNKTAKTIIVSRHKFDNAFEKISHHFSDEIFIRRTNHREMQTLEPNSKRSIVNLHLLQSSDVVYWIIPEDLKPKYGINQLQESFSAAMRVLGLNDNLKCGSVSIGGIKMGWAATDIIMELWNCIKGMEEDESDRPINLEVQVTPKLNHNLTGIRLVGTNDSEVFAVGEIGAGFEEKIYQSMIDISERQCSNAAITAFKLQLCIKGNPQIVSVMKGPQYEAIIAIKTLYDGRKKEEYLAPLVFWLIYERFGIYDVDDPVLPIPWITDYDDDRSTLKEFRSCLKKLWKGYDDKLDLSFSLVQPETGLYFYITEETTEQQWMENVLRWVQSPRLRVKRRATCKYVVPSPDDIFKPNNLEETEATGNEPMQGEMPGSPISAVPADQPVPEEYQATPAANIGLVDPSDIEITQAPGHGTEIATNKTLEELKSKPHTESLSVIEPGFVPAVPIHGPSSENPLQVGSSPLVYTNQLAATEILALHNENDILRGTVLARMTRCPLCDDALDTSKFREVERHFQAHRDIEAAIQGCPLCNTSRWIHMTAVERKTHVDRHYKCYVRDEVAKLKGTFERLTPSSTNNTQERAQNNQNLATRTQLIMHNTELETMGTEYNRARSLFENACPRCDEDLESMPLDMATKHVFDCLAMARPMGGGAVHPNTKPATKNGPKERNQSTKPAPRRSKSIDDDPTYKPPAEDEGEEEDDNDIQDPNSASLSKPEDSPTSELQQASGSRDVTASTKAATLLKTNEGENGNAAEVENVSAKENQEGQDTKQESKTNVAKRKLSTTTEVQKPKRPRRKRK